MAEREFSYTFSWRVPPAAAPPSEAAADIETARPTVPQTVQVAGSFNAWGPPLALARKDVSQDAANGGGAVEFELVHTYEAESPDLVYKYLVDGEWACNHNEKVAVNDQGFMNNVGVATPVEKQGDGEDRGADEGAATEAAVVHEGLDETIPRKEDDDQLAPQESAGQVATDEAVQDAAREQAEPEAALEASEQVTPISVQAEDPLPDAEQAPREQVEPVAIAEPSEVNVEVVSTPPECSEQPITTEDAAEPPADIDAAKSGQAVEMPPVLEDTIQQDDISPKDDDSEPGDVDGSQLVPEEEPIAQESAEVVATGVTEKMAGGLPEDDVATKENIAPADTPAPQESERVEEQQPADIAEEVTLEDVTQAEVPVVEESVRHGEEPDTAASVPAQASCAEPTEVISPEGEAERYEAVPEQTGPIVTEIPAMSDVREAAEGTCEPKVELVPESGDVERQAAEASAASGAAEAAVSEDVHPDEGVPAVKEEQQPPAVDDEYLSSAPASDVLTDKTDIIPALSRPADRSVDADGSQDAKIGEAAAPAAVVAESPAEQKEPLDAAQADEQEEVAQASEPAVPDVKHDEAGAQATVSGEDEQDLPPSEPPVEAGPEVEGEAPGKRLSNDSGVIELVPLTAATGAAVIGGAALHAANDDKEPAADAPADKGKAVESGVPKETQAAATDAPAAKASSDAASVSGASSSSGEKSQKSSDHKSSKSSNSSRSSVGENIKAKFNKLRNLVRRSLSPKDHKKNADDSKSTHSSNSLSSASSAAVATGADTAMSASATQDIESSTMAPTVVATDHTNKQAAAHPLPGKVTAESTVANTGTVTPAETIPEGDGSSGGAATTPKVDGGKQRRRSVFQRLFNWA